MIKELSETKTTSVDMVFVLFVFQSSPTGLLVAKDEKAKTLSAIGDHTVELTDFSHYVEEVDELLYQLETKVQKKAKDTLLVVPGGFMDATTGVLSNDSKAVFKKLFDELDLKPIGFVDSLDVIRTLMGDSEDYMLVECSSGMSVRMIKAGQVIASETKEASLDPSADVQELLQKIHEKHPISETVVIYTPKSKSEVVDFVRSGVIESGLCLGEPTITHYDPTLLEHATIGLVQSTLFPGTVPVPLAAPAESISLDTQQTESRSPVEEDVVDEEESLVIGQEIVAPPHQEIAGFVIDDVGPQGQEFSTSENSIPFDNDESSDDMVKESPLSAITKRFSFPAMPFAIPHKRLTIVLSLAVLMLLGIAGLFFFLHKADVTLVLKPASIKQELEVPISAFSVQKKEVPIETSSSIATTGTATVGEKSRGEVTVYSGDTKTVTLGPSQAMKTASGLEFQLDKEIKLSSSTAQVTSEGNILTVTSKQTVGATARNIGEEFNIAKDAKLTFNGIPQTSVFGVVTKAFSGGSKRQIQTPSQDDVKKLQKANGEQIKKELAKQEGSSDEIMIPQLQSSSDKVETFSAQPGKEASTLTLKAQQKVQIAFLDRKDVLVKILADINEKLPDESTADLRSLQITVKELKEKDSIIVFEVQAKPVPAIDIADVKREVRGKSSSAINDILNRRYDVDSVDIHFANNLYFLNSILPFFIKNISVSIDIQ
jgi:hypothetical protein